MDPLKLHSEIFQPEGGAAGQGIRRALGRPKLDPISMLIREAVQNSWDARVDNGRETRVQFSALLEKIEAPEAECLRGTIFAERPGNHPLSAQLNTQLGRLILQDRGTVGRGGGGWVGVVGGGPTRPEHRFVNFCRMFGRAAEGLLGGGGGTYGYGKGQFYLVSSAATILVHTRSMEHGRGLERLIGLSLWNANPDGLQTGRHWWGAEDKHGRVGPAEGERASRLAEAIGFRPFGRGETGTSVMIIAPKFGTVASGWDVAARCIAESMAIWFWPRMLGACDDLGTIGFEAAFNKTPVAVPNPVRQEPFRLYADALKNLRGRVRTERDPPTPAVVREIRCERPRARLGWLSLALAARQERERFAVTRIEAHPFAEQIVGADGQAAGVHHVALIRSQGQVIRYVDCRAYPEETMEYAGVFLAAGDSTEVDEAFASAEPPSHDDWTPDDMDDERQKRFVRGALREIKTATELFAESGRPDPSSMEQDPLGAISAELGELMSAPGTGARPESRGGGGGGGARNGPSRLVVDGPGSLRSMDGQIVLVVPFEVAVGPDGTAAVGARARVMVAGGAAESEAPRGGEHPHLLGWKNARGEVVRDPILRVGAADGPRWEAIVLVPGDVMVGVTLELL